MNSISTLELSKALKSLEIALAAPKNDLNRDATIQRFEFTVELAWKTCKKIMGTSSSAPKEVIREMAQNAYIQDLDLWLESIDQRNSTSHSYREEIAEKVYDFAKIFAPHVKTLLTKIESK